MLILNRTGLRLFPFLLGLLFFAASLTPSLIPREWLIQGVLGGLVMAFGYLIGRAIMGLWWAVELPTFKGCAALVFYVVLTLPIFVVLVLCLEQANNWQNGIRSRMGMDLVDIGHTVRMVMTAFVVFAVLFLAGFLVRMAFNALRQQLYAFLPARTANIAGLLLMMIGIFVVTRDGILDKVIENLDESVTIAQELFDRGEGADLRRATTRWLHALSFRFVMTD